MRRGPRSRRRRRGAVAITSCSMTVLALALSVCGSSPPTGRLLRASHRGGDGSLRSRGGIHKIKHIIVIEQENRSFDSYFGTYRVRTASPWRADNPPSAYPRPQAGARSRTTTPPT